MAGFEAGRGSWLLLDIRFDLRQRLLAAQDVNIPAVNEEGGVGLADEGIPEHGAHGHLVGEPDATVPDLAISKPYEVFWLHSLHTEQAEEAPRR